MYISGSKYRFFGFRLAKTLFFGKNGWKMPIKTIFWRLSLIYNSDILGFRPFGIIRMIQSSFQRGAILKQISLFETVRIFISAWYHFEADFTFWNRSNLHFRPYRIFISQLYDLNLANYDLYLGNLFLI